MGITVNEANDRRLPERREMIDLGPGEPNLGQCAGERAPGKTQLGASDPDDVNKTEQPKASRRVERTRTGEGSKK